MNPLGPIFVFELNRLMRRTRQLFGRCCYILLLLVLCGIVYRANLSTDPNSLWDFLTRSQLDRRSAANFGYAFFTTFALVQYAIVTMATAANAPAVLAEEQERKTLHFLLTTTLADHEIVLGKTLARGMLALMLVLAGLPVLAIVQFMGGVDPALLAAAYLATFASMFSTAALGAAISVVSPTVRVATGRTIGLVIAYTVVVPFISMILQRLYGGVRVVPSTWVGVTLGQIADWVNVGNIFWALSIIGRQLSVGQAIDDVLSDVLTWFLVAHVGFGVIVGGWFCFRLRRILSRQEERAAKGSTKTGADPLTIGRRAVSSRPVYWRETVTAVGRAKDRPWFRWGKRLAFIASFGPLLVVFYEGGKNGRIANNLHEFMLSFGTLVTFGSLLFIAVAAGSMISRERRQGTWDELKLTDLTNREILVQKGLASLWSARWFHVWLIIHWAIALAFGAIVLWAVPLVLLVYSINAWFAVSLGMLCSIYHGMPRKTQPLVIWGLIGYAAAPWSLPMGASVLRIARNVENYAMFAAGLSPPMSIGFLTLSPDVRSRPWSRVDHRVELFVLGLVLSLALMLVFSMTCQRWIGRRLLAERRG